MTGSFRRRRVLAAAALVVSGGLLVAGPVAVSAAAPPVPPASAASAPPASAPSAPPASAPSAGRTVGRPAPVPAGIARRLAAVAASASRARAAPRAAGVRPIPGSTLATDLPTRLPVQDYVVYVPFTIVAAANTYRKPLAVVELFGDQQIYTATGFSGTPGQTVFRGFVAIDAAAIRQFGPAVWVFGVFDDTDPSGETGQVSPLPTTIKLRSLLGQRVTRSADTVTIQGATRVYDPVTASEDNRFVPDRARTVYVQRYTSSGWRTLRTLRSDSRGHVTARIRIPFRVGVRLTTRDTPTTFGAITVPAVR